MAENRIMRNQPPGGQRPTEDRERMAAEAAAQFDAEEAELLARRRDRRPLRQMLDTVEQNFANIGGMMNPALPLQLDRRNIAAAAREARRAAAETEGAAASETRAAPEISRPRMSDAGGQPAMPRARGRTRPTPSRRREMTADELNQISLELARGTRQGPLAPGAEQNIARRMGAEGYNYKKGGVVGKKPGIPKVVKKAAGGKVKTPSVPGRSVGRPATKVAATGTRQMAKAIKPTRPVAMPFKKGGKVSAKGKK